MRDKHVLLLQEFCFKENLFGSSRKMSSSYSKLKVGQALEDKDLGPVIQTGRNK